jgi:phage terminase small subunit
MASEVGVTPKQKRFGDEYPIDLKASERYRPAGRRGRRHSARAGGHDYLTKPHLAADIAEKPRKIGERLDLDKNDALAILLDRFFIKESKVR